MALSPGVAVNRKAQLAFAALSSTKAKDYDAIKAAILTRYNVNGIVGDFTQQSSSEMKHTGSYRYA